MKQHRACRRNVRQQRFTRMTRAHAEVVRNTNSAAEEKLKNKNIKIKSTYNNCIITANMTKGEK